LGEIDTQLERDIAGTEALCGEAVAVADQIGNLGGKMLCLTHLGRARAQAGDTETALAHLRQVIRLSETAEWYGIAETHRLLAETLLETKDEAEAQSSAVEALVWARCVDQPGFVGRAWRTLGEVIGRTGIPASVDGVVHDARSCFEESEQVFREGGSRAERALTLAKWAAYELVHGDPERGDEMQRKADTMLTQLGIKDPGMEDRPGAARPTL
jgi:hypothetical protein